MKAVRKSTSRKRAPKARDTSNASDPVFTAIEAHRAAWDALKQTITEWSPFDASPEDDECKIEIGCKYSVRVPDDVDKTVTGAWNDLVSHFGKDFAEPLRKSVMRVGKTIKAALKAANQDLEDRREKTGYNVARERLEDAEEAETRALGYLVNTRPTTLAGLEALAAYAGRIYADTIEGSRHNEAAMLLKTIESAALSLHITHKKPSLIEVADRILKAVDVTRMLYEHKDAKRIGRKNRTKGFAILLMHLDAAYKALAK